MMAGSKTPERGALEWLHERRDRDNKPLISDEEYAAWVRLRAEFERAHMQPRVTASWSGLPSDRKRGPAGAGLEMHERIADAQTRVRKALSAVGMEHANILLDVCCFDAKLGEVERKSGWPQRSGKVILQLALRQLARHYGFLRDQNAMTSQIGGQIRGWGTEGYQGTLSSWHDGVDGPATNGIGAATIRK